jgi:tetratricopeptide (TPR) repeat protein
LNAAGKAKQAQKKISEVLELARKIEKGDTAYVSQLLELQGDINMGQNQIDEAARVYAISLSIREKVLTGANPQVTGLLNKLGEIEIKQGKHQVALQHFQKSLEMSRKMLGNSHPLLAYGELNIAACYADMKDDKNARKSYEEAIRIMERSAGEDNDGTASVLEQFSAYLKSSGKEAEAKALDKRIADIRSNPDARRTAINLKVLN